MPVHPHSREEVNCDHWWVDDTLRVHYSAPPRRRSSSVTTAAAKGGGHRHAAYSPEAALVTPPVVTNTGPLFRCEGDTRTYRLLRPHPVLVQALWEEEPPKAVDSTDPLSAATDLVAAWERGSAAKARLGAGAVMNALSAGEAGAGEARTVVAPPAPPTAAAAAEARKGVHFGQVQVRDYERIVEDDDDASTGSGGARDGGGDANGGAGGSTGLGRRGATAASEAARQRKAAASGSKSHHHGPKLTLGWNVTGEIVADLDAVEAEREKTRVPRGHMHSMPISKRREIASEAQRMFRQTVSDTKPPAATHGPPHASAGHEEHAVRGILKHDGGASGVSFADPAQAAAANASRRRRRSGKKTPLREHTDGEARDLHGWSLGDDDCLHVASGHTSRVVGSSGRIAFTESGSSYRLCSVDPHVRSVIESVGVLFDPDNPLVNVEALKHAYRVITSEARAESITALLEEMHGKLSRGPAKAWVDGAFQAISATLEEQLGSLGMSYTPSSNFGEPEEDEEEEFVAGDAMMAAGAAAVYAQR